MEGKKLNNIWQEVNSLRKDFAEAWKAQREERAKRLEADKANAEKIARAIQDKEVADVTPVVEATKTAASQVAGSTNQTTKAVKELGESTIKVEITNHQEQKDIDIPEQVTLNDAQFQELKQALKVTVEAPDVNVDVAPSEVKMPDELPVVHSQEYGDYIPVMLTDGTKPIPIENLLKDIFMAAQSGIGIGAAASSGGGGHGGSDISGGLDNLLLANGTDNLLLASGSEDVLLLA